MSSPAPAAARGAIPADPAGPDGLLQGLNDAQRRAVLHGKGPLLIVAGAGTGKTTVLTRRIAHLITSKQALPGEVLALTFTEKAAAEMEERVDKLVPYGFNDVWVSTFHSFGDKVLREHAFDLGLSPDLRVITQPEAVVLVRENLFQFKLDYYRPLNDPTRFVESLLSTFSRAKDEEIAPPEFLAQAEADVRAAQDGDRKEAAQKLLEVARAYETYEDLKKGLGLIDFGDQVLLCLRLFRERPSVLSAIQRRYRFIVVDEFQDTNYAQFELLKKVAEGHRNITVVGDDDQSIYKFRGACLSNILGFRKAYPEAEEVVLQENYRSSQTILDAAYKLIQHNNPDRLEHQDRISKLLRSQRGPGQAIRQSHFDTLFSQCEFVASEIKARVDRGGFEPSDFAVLVRTNAMAEPFIKSLNLAGIPWRFSGNAGLYEQEEIRVVLAFLRAVDQPGDNASLYYLAISPLYGLDGSDCALLTDAAQRAKRSLWDVFKDGSGEGAPPLSAGAQPILARIVDDVGRYRSLSARLPTGNLIYNFLDEKGVFRDLAAAADLKNVQAAQNFQRFFDVVKKFSQVARYDRAHTFILYLDALRLAGDDPSSAEVSFDENSVQVLTVHAAKGLEFRSVFLAGLEQGHFPAADRPDLVELPKSLIKDILPTGDYHIQEERRLFYVGMTRAKEELFLCSARDLGKKKAWKVSRFVLESLDKPQADPQARAQPLDAIKVFAAQGAPRTAPAPAPAAPEPVAMQATAVEEYLKCPLKYKFSRVLKIPVLMHHSAVFGVAVHEALKAFNLARREGRTLACDELLKVFKTAWRSEGFISREHEERRFKEGQGVLKAFHEKEPPESDPPTLVEESFRMVVGGARIRGRWDRVDVAPGKSAVIDYKTGDVKDAKDAEQKARDSVQLGLYALAFEARFGRLPDEAALYFVKSGARGSVRPTADRLAKVRDKIEKAVEGVARMRFEPSAGYHCRQCAYERICPALNKDV